MNLVIDRANLLKSLNHVQSVVERRTTIPILSNVRIDTGEDSLDEEFRAKKFVKMLQGYRTTRVIRVSDI